MKKKLFILLPLLFGLTIVSCNNNVESESNEEEQSSSIEESSTTSQVKEYPAKEFTSYSEKTFKLEEFPNVKFSLGPRELNEEGNKYVLPLYVNDVKVTNDYPRSLWAYDVNKDGYRELVFRWESGSRY